MVGAFQGVECLVDGLEPLFGVNVTMVAVRMMLLDQLSVFFLYHLEGGAGGQPQY